MARHGSGSESYFRGLGPMERSAMYAREGEILRQVQEAHRQKRRQALTDVATVLRALETKLKADKDTEAAIENMIEEAGPIDNEQGGNDD